MESWVSAPTLPPSVRTKENIDQDRNLGYWVLNDLRVLQKALFIEFRHPYATPRHRISEKHCPDSNLGSLFLNDLGIFQKAFFIEIRQGPYIRVSLIEIRAQTGGVANL